MTPAHVRLVTESLRVPRNAPVQAARATLQSVSAIAELREAEPAAEPRESSTASRMRPRSTAGPSGREGREIAGTMLSCRTLNRLSSLLKRWNGSMNSGRSDARLTSKAP